MGKVEINGDSIEGIHTAEFSDILNEVNRAELNFKADDFQRVQAQIGNTVKYVTGDNKRYDFIIDSRATTDENLIKLICLGAEEIAVNIDVDLNNLSNATNKTARAGNYINLSSQLIYDDLLSHLSGWSLTLSNPVTVASFKLNDSDSVWNGVSRLANLLAQEIKIDYANQTFIIADNLGDSQVITLNERADFSGVPSFTEERAKGKKVIVYGKGDGDLQIKATAQDGSYSLGDKTVKVNDPTITTDDQAQAVADKELSRLKQNIEHYNIPAMSLAGLDVVFNVSDTIIVNSPSVGVINQELKIVRLTYLLEKETEYINIEVTNSEYSRAFKSQTQKLAEENLIARNGGTFNQGSGNTLTFGNSLNAKLTAPLKVVFQIPNDFIKDETGNIRVNNFTVDYDIDPYRAEFGTATYVGGDLDVSGSSSDTAPDVLNNSGSTQPSVTGTSDSTQLMTFVGSDTGSEGVSTSGWDNIMRVGLGGTYEWLFVTVKVDITASFNADLWMRIQFGSNSFYEASLAYATFTGDEFAISIPIPLLVSTSSNIDVDMWAKAGGSVSVSASMEVYALNLGHSHGDGSYAASNHSHTDGSYGAENHPHFSGSYEVDSSELGTFALGDDVNEGSTTNSNSVSLYLDFWNGSVWQQKHSVLSSGVTIEENVDVSNGGQYPDTGGFWRVRVEPNSSNADFVQSLVKLKHNLDN